MTIVAIDGPAGAGKSTVARAVAEALGFTHLDTGAMYRAVALAALDSGTSIHDESAVVELARTLGSYDDDRIREPLVTAAVSVVSAYPGVRSAMVERQRALAVGADVVAEGRDIGTTVFPEADVKIYLTASLEERARRRCLQEGAPDDPPTIERTMAAIGERDTADSERASSPLRRADDAIVVDTTGRPVEDVVRSIVALVHERA
jgi:CMP/dCMP kinase